MAQTLDSPAPPAPLPAQPVDHGPRPKSKDGNVRTPKWLYAVMTVGLFFVVLPFVWMVVSSFKPEAEVMSVPPTWWPETVTFDNYSTLFTTLDFPTYFTNSAIVAGAVALGNVVFCSMLGYALAKLDFPGKRLVLVAVLITIMVPGVVMFVPLFITVNGLGLANNYGGMIVPFLVGAGGVFLLRQFLLDIPDELLEAARIDGAGEFRIFFRIVLPLCGPALATIGILTFMSSWNNLLWPLVVAQSKDLYTLPVALAFLSQGDGTINYGVMLAGSVLTIMPIVLVFLFLQRYFISGIATTGIK